MFYGSSWWIIKYVEYVVYESQWIITFCCFILLFSTDLKKPNYLNTVSKSDFKNKLPRHGKYINYNSTIFLVYQSKYYKFVANRLQVTYMPNVADWRLLYINISKLNIVTISTLIWKIIWINI